MSSVTLLLSSSTTQWKKGMLDGSSFKHFTKYLKSIQVFYQVKPFKFRTNQSERPCAWQPSDCALVYLNIFMKTSWELTDENVHKHCWYLHSCMCCMCGNVRLNEASRHDILITVAYLDSFKNQNIFLLKYFIFLSNKQCHKRIWGIWG